MKYALLMITLHCTGWFGANCEYGTHAIATFSTYQECKDAVVQLHSRDYFCAEQPRFAQGKEE